MDSQFQLWYVCCELLNYYASKILVQGNSYLRYFSEQSNDQLKYKLFSTFEVIQTIRRVLKSYFLRLKIIHFQLNLICWTNFCNSSYGFSPLVTIFRVHSPLTDCERHKSFFFLVQFNGICILQTLFWASIWGMKYFSMSFYSVSVNWIFLWFSYQRNIQWPSTC